MPPQLPFYPCHRSVICGEGDAKSLVTQRAPVMMIFKAEHRTQNTEHRTQNTDLQRRASLQFTTNETQSLVMPANLHLHKKTLFDSIAIGPRILFKLALCYVMPFWIVHRVSLFRYTCMCLFVLKVSSSRSNIMDESNVLTFRKVSMNFWRTSFYQDCITMRIRWRASI